jgi:hypothetical protein
VEDLALEGLEARDPGVGRKAQLACAGHEKASLDVVTAPHPDQPAAGFVVEVRPLDLMAEADVIVHPVLACALLEVALDLALLAVLARPVVARLEGVRVEVGGDVAGGAGIGVVPPDASDLVGLLEDCERDPGPPELYPHADPAEARPNDRDRSGLRFAHLAALIWIGVGSALPPRESMAGWAG